MYNTTKFIMIMIYRWPYFSEIFKTIGRKKKSLRISKSLVFQRPVRRLACRRTTSRYKGIVNLNWEQNNDSLLHQSSVIIKILHSFIRLFIIFQVFLRTFHNSSKFFFNWQFFIFILFKILYGPTNVNSFVIAICLF